MRSANPVKDRLWSIVLAGGEGERIRPLVEKWLGLHRPKQYCTFVGTRSMFQHTLDRADLLTPPERRVTVVARSHRQDACSQLLGRATGKLILQPANRGTVAGILLPLAYARASDPDATVVIYPSDHFVYPEERFIEFVREAATAVEKLTKLFVLLGVVPEGVELEYGWIQPGRRLGQQDSGLRAVEAFVEKPGHSAAREAMRRGALWNTFVVVAKLGKLWELGWRYFPDVMPLFEGFASVIGSRGEQTLLEAVYRLMPSRDFSTDLLTYIPEEVAVLELDGMIWSDWGRPERIARTLLKIGKLPVFPAELLRAS